jgi:hypothetical protein
VARFWDGEKKPTAQPVFGKQNVTGAPGADTNVPWADTKSLIER